MKKTLKFVVIFMVSTLVILIGGIGGYNLIMNNQTFYIYDLRFVEPVANARGYVYTENGQNQKTIVSAREYMQSEADNYLEIAVYVSTSNGNTNINIYSSDESVAKIEYHGNKCYVKYLKAGEAIITTSIGSVTDSFKLEVLDKIPSDFRVYDFSYYGENYATRLDYVNSIVCYSEEEEELAYEYSYKLFDVAGNEDLEYFNNALLEVDENSYLGNYFKEISIDKSNQKLKIVCNKQNLLSSIHTTIAINSFYMVDGQKCLRDIFEVDVYIIANEVEFIQIELSTNPDFTNKSIFMNINDVEYSDNLSSDELMSYLTCQRLESNLELAGENPVYNVYVTEKTPEFYLKFRLVYTNGTILDLNMSNFNLLYGLSINGAKMTTNSKYLLLDSGNYLEQEPMGEYFILKLTPEYLISRLDKSAKFEFSLLGDFANLPLNGASYLLRTFKFEYLDLNNVEDVKKLYTQNEDGTYSFSYWDNRTASDNVAYDENGNVVDFLE